MYELYYKSIIKKTITLFIFNIKFKFIKKLNFNN